MSKDDNKLVERVFEWIKDGMRSDEIRATLMIEDESMNDSRFEALIKKAHLFAENVINKDREYTFRLHMERYESIYNKCMDMRDSWGRELEPKGKDWTIIVGKYISAAKALKMKEDLLGLHEKNFVVEINNYKATVVEQIPTKGEIPGYNIDNLTPEEKIEFLNLIRESRTVPVEGVHRVIVRKTVVEINQNGGYDIGQKDINIDQVDTIDVTYEDMPTTNVVEKFTVIQDKKEEGNVPELLAGGVIKDDVPKEDSKVIEEIKNKYNDKLLDEFKKKLKNKP